MCTPIETVNCTLVTEEQCLTVPGVECEGVADQVSKIPSQKCAETSKKECKQVPRTECSGYAG